MTDLSSLTADDLAEKVRAVIAEPPESITVPDDEQTALAALADLCRRLKIAEDALETLREDRVPTTYGGGRHARDAFIRSVLAAIRPNPKP